MQLQEIQLDTALPQVDNELADWRFAFAAAPDGGSGERVFSYGSAESLRKDTELRGQWLQGVKNTQKAADIMAQRVSKAVDFSRYDLVVVQLLDGGRRLAITAILRSPNAVEFCIDPTPNPSGVSGMAMRTTAKVILPPKACVFISAPSGRGNFSGGRCGNCPPV
ncbi:MAG: hypothetical protein HZT40_14820 [Candidatus Thiothrix singaporensis]|uniref:Uncharacterized protein n=1 Tax=Candidatus Thiothrix singaporensis TaxID=2799669 RepID=A0A7L6AU96_9GAMM|nr:MAG: hypothetical protein HZT40_14820 [Candidatus Thiothrix singaporensis]